VYVGKQVSKEKTGEKTVREMGRWSAEGCRQIAQFKKLAFRGKILECLGEEPGREAVVRKGVEELQEGGQEDGGETHMYVELEYHATLL